MDRTITTSSFVRYLQVMLTRVNQLLDHPRFVIGLLLLVVAPVLWWRLAVAPPPWFDEGYRVNMAQTLVNHGQYATQSVDGYRLFDQSVTTGPVDIGAIALMFSVFGVGYWQARLAVTVFGLVGVVAMTLIAQRWLGWRGSLVAVLAALFTPVPDDVRYLLLARQVMGEVPALSLILLGSWLWFVSWARPGWERPIGAGILIGLGLLSKSQMLFGLGPALLVVSLLRASTRDQAGWRELVTGAVTLAVLLGWQWLGYGLSTEADRLANRETLAVMGAVQLFIGSWGAYVPLTGWWGVSLSLAACVLTAVSLGRRHPRVWREREWAFVFLSLSAFSLCFWYVNFSVGWVRYTFLASQLSLIVLGVRGAEAIALRVQSMPTGSASRWRVALVGVGIGLMFGGQLMDLERRDRASGLIETQTYVRTQLPPTAVIETWEWELASVIGQERTHIPSAEVLMRAVNHLTRGGSDPSAEYDVLQADPDYLIVGQMGGWTGIYRAALDDGHFRQIASHDDYSVYVRVR
jgi:4-amino-4-deoxy-L-arabinose transferase-like glycosyltransferase